MSDVVGKGVLGYLEKNFPDTEARERVEAEIEKVTESYGRAKTAWSRLQPASLGAMALTDEQKQAVNQGYDRHFSRYGTAAAAFAGDLDEKNVTDEENVHDDSFKESWGEQMLLRRAETEFETTHGPLEKYSVSEQSVTSPALGGLK